MSSERDKLGCDFASCVFQKIKGDRIIGECTCFPRTKHGLRVRIWKLAEEIDKLREAYHEPT